MKKQTTDQQIDSNQNPVFNEESKQNPPFVEESKQSSVFTTFDNKFLKDKEGQKVFQITTGMDNIEEEALVLGSKLIILRQFRKDLINSEDPEFNEKIQNLDELYDNDLNIGHNVNLLQPISHINAKEKSKNILSLEYCRMTLEDLIKRQLDQPFEFEFIIHLSAQIISAVMFCHVQNKLAIRNLSASSFRFSQNYLLKLSNIHKSKDTIATCIKFGTRIDSDESYKAPEMFNQDFDNEGTFGIKADCWAIGVIIYYIWKRQLPFVKEHPKDPIEEKIRAGWRPEYSVDPKEQQLNKIISQFLEIQEDLRIDLRYLKDISVDNDFPLFKLLKEKVLYFYDVEQNQMQEFMKNYKCLNCEQLEKYWHHSDILSEQQYKYICSLIREKEGFCRPTLMAQINRQELKKGKNNLNERRLQIAKLAKKRAPKTLMIALVADAEDKECKNTKIIGVYVATRFQNTTKEATNAIPDKASLPSVKLEHREAPVGFYIDKNDIKLLFYKNETVAPTFFSYSATSKGAESGAFFGVGSGFIISNYRLSRDFNQFNTKNWEFPDDAPKDASGNLLLFQNLKDALGNPVTPKDENKSFRALCVELFSIERY